MTLSQYLKIGGQFTFPTNNLTKNLSSIYGTKYKRNRAIPKSYNPSYNPNRIINKAAAGTKLTDTHFMEFNTLTPEKKKTSAIKSYRSGNDALRSKTAEITSKQLLKKETPANDNSLIYDPVANYLALDEIQDEIALEYGPSLTVATSTPIDYSGTIGYKAFSNFYDQVEKEIPEAKKYRNFLTRKAYDESRFLPTAKNLNAPAYGLFQFMLGEKDGKSWNNISHYAGVTPEEFMADPILLIKAAVKFAEDNLGNFTEEDKLKAKNLGFTEFGLLSGAWLGGVGGVRKVLNGTGNPSDRHHDPNGKGTDVLTLMRTYSKK